MASETPHPASDPAPPGALSAEFLERLRQEPDEGPVLETVPLPALAALAESTAADLREAGTPDLEARRRAWELLDHLRHRAVLTRIPHGEREAWARRILDLVVASDFTVGMLFRQRVNRYGSRPLFRAPTSRGVRTFSWRQTAARVETYARGFMALLGEDPPAPVALLTENRIEGVWVDLACLASGIENVPIPTTATLEDMVYILEHSGAGTVVVSGGALLEQVLSVRPRLPGVRRIVCLDPLPPGRTGGDLLDLQRVALRSGDVPFQEMDRRWHEVRIEDRATLMYTSGTTGTPKGIQFSQKNIVFKRFARALALPEVGEGDVFLSYLPLYHTFGRYLEMMGAIFWGAEYCFLPSPSIKDILEGMRAHQPTIFISVPSKWLQLYEWIARHMDPESTPPEVMTTWVRQATGGRLRWGLSAAGHLDASVFRFFQRHGVELMSGFGMTEATGGITMTPPGEYRDESLGVPLPGIETRLADDGELWIRGPYVMMGYWNPPDGDTGFDAEGWLHTGDLMETDADGHFYLVDRKKEIYKNLRGETIAPQRIENLFREFPTVGRVFLVGDHREYNTLLVWPDPDAIGKELPGADAAAVREHFGTLVASVNKFLAPYERIVDFAVLPRDLDPERGELTPKGTLRRKVVEANFQDLIQPMYRRAHLRVGGAELVIPNWLLQALGLTTQGVRVEENAVVLGAARRRLSVRRVRAGITRVGSWLYGHDEGPLNLGDLPAAPELWLGNLELFDALGEETFTHAKSRRARGGLRRVGAAEPPELDAAGERALDEALSGGEFRLAHVHLAAAALLSRDIARAGLGLRVLRQVLQKADAGLAEMARLALTLSPREQLPAIRRQSLVAWLSLDRVSKPGETLERFLGSGDRVLDRETRERICELNLSADKLEAWMQVTRRFLAESGESAEARARCVRLLRLLAEYGAAHPTRYRPLRAFLAQMGLEAPHPDLARAAEAAREALVRGFRDWLGPAQTVAVDPETGEEYGWDDVVSIEPDVPEADRRRLMAALRGTSLVREAVFLFSGGVSVRLSDIPPGGVWIRRWGEGHGKTVYRLTVQTRYQGSYEIAVNLNHDLKPEEVREELTLLILCGRPGARGALTEDLGGYWEDHDLWTEEFIPGETLDRLLARLARNQEGQERLWHLWPFLAWSALSAYVDFWRRSGRRLELAEPGTRGVIVPTRDYLHGARLVSVASRRPFRGMAAMLETFRTAFVEPVERAYPFLRGLADWNLILSSVPEVLGEAGALEALREAAGDTAVPDPSGRKEAVARLITQLETRGYVPMRLHFAAHRYRRWARLSGDPTREARARTMQELYETYGLDRLLAAYPETRVRFFRETVLQDASPPLAEGLEEIIQQLRRGELDPEHTMDAVAELRARVPVNEDEDYFLARLSFPHLRPEDTAAFVATVRGARAQSEMVVTLEDAEGHPFRIRHALSPKEVARLHRLFLASNLDVHFGPEHQFLVALNDREAVIGGIYYEVDEDNRTAHLEKIVVAEPFRKKGVAHALMHEFFNRLRAAGVRAVTTGFYRPEYFYGYGFRIERRYAGLVKRLDDDAPSPPESTGS